MKSLNTYIIEKLIFKKGMKYERNILKEGKPVCVFSLRKDDKENQLFIYEPWTVISIDKYSIKYKLENGRELEFPIKMNSKGTIQDDDGKDYSKSIYLTTEDAANFLKQLVKRGADKISIINDYFDYTDSLDLENKDLIFCDITGGCLNRLKIKEVKDYITLYENT